MFVAVRAAAMFLDTLADRLDRWAMESRNGGWSTHQVSANINATNDCRRMAASLREALRNDGPPPTKD